MRRNTLAMVTAVGVMAAAGTLAAGPLAMACGHYQMDVHIPAGGVTYTYADGAGTGSTAVAEVTTETQPYNGGGLPLWSQIVAEGSQSYLGSARTLDPGYCTSPALWYNGGPYRQVELSVHQQYLSGVQSIHATGYWTP